MMSSPEHPCPKLRNQHLSILPWHGYQGLKPVANLN